MSDLGELLSHAERALEAGYTGRTATPPGVAGARSRIRRRRATRHWTQGAGAVAAVGVVGAAALLGLGHRDAPLPAVTPSPSLTTAAATPTPAATSSTPPTPTRDALSSAPGLPPYRPLTAAVLAGVGPGWVATVHEPTPFTADGDRQGPPVVLVASPAGELYRAGPVTNAGNWFTLQRWDAAEPRTVLVSNQGVLSRLDLLTGALVPDDHGLPESSSYMGRAADGRSVWSGGTGAYLVGPNGPASLVTNEYSFALSPDGRRVVVGPVQIYAASTTLSVVDVLTGARTELSGVKPDGMTECYIDLWITSDTLLESCSDQATSQIDESALIATVRIVGNKAITTVVHRYTADEPRLTGGAVRVRDGLVVALGESPRSCDSRLYTWDAHGRSTPLQIPARNGGPTSWSVAVVGETVYAQDFEACTDAVSPSKLVAYDLGSGSSKVLVPLPTDGATGIQGLSSFAVLQ